MIIGIHHTQITIPKGSETEAKHFYCRILQLSEIEKPESLKGRGGFWLQVGNKEIHIGTEDGVDRSKTKAHVAYEVNDIAYWEKLLNENSVTILDSVPIPGYKRFEFRDPFGNRVEMIQSVK